MHHRFAMICIVGLVTSSCRTPSTPNPVLVADASAPDVPVSLEDAERGLRAYLQTTQLSQLPDEAQTSEGALASMMRWKSNRMLDAVTPFDAALTRDADPDVEEFALLRIGIAYLNYACEVAMLPAPSALEASQRGIVEDVIHRSAFESMAEAKASLDAASKLNGRRRDLVDRLRAGLPKDEGAIDQACVELRGAWTSPDGSSLTTVSKTGCDDGEGWFCWVWASWADGSDDARNLACERDVARACVELGDREVALSGPRSNPADTTAAERMYARACALGSADGCRRELAVFVPARVDDYRTACIDDGDAVSCLKLARVLSLAAPDESLWMCTSSQQRTSPSDTRSACATGDAFACATLAGSLKVDPRYLIRITEDAASDPQRAALACSEGSNIECTTGARAFARAGDWGCAAAMMAESCGRGNTEACGFAEVD